jgi:hypothetical protein
MDNEASDQEIKTQLQDEGSGNAQRELDGRPSGFAAPA